MLVYDQNALLVGGRPLIIEQKLEAPFVTDISVKI
jgi:hypothetical protein